MEKMNKFNIFNKNLKYLMEQNNITQRGLASVTGVSVASINNLLNKSAEPSAQLLLKLKNAYDVSIDDLLTIDIKQSKELKTTEYTVNLNKFCGTFMMYFYDSSEYKGKVSSFSKNTLRYAVISFIRQNKSDRLTAVANFFKERVEAEEFKGKVEVVEDVNAKMRLHEKSSQFYLGKLQSTISQIFIYLKSDLLNDQSLIILNNPPSNKQYIGGLGTSNSVSRGREHMPCVQFVLVSKSTLNIPDGEVYNMLSLGVSDINVETEADKLLNLFKNLYINSANLSEELSEFQKKKIFEDSLCKILEDLIDANMFRFAKISNREDDDYYRLIKEFIG